MYFTIGVINSDGEVTILSVSRTNPYSLLNNSRFYILAASLLMSALIVGLLRIHIPSDQLFVIRTQQVFGLLCLIYWYVALAISPIGHIVGKQRMKRVEFTRRAIGVSAFYFAFLHTIIALWGQLGGLGQLQHLPTLFQWSLAGGFVALIILGIMAVTSFDRIVRFMTYRKWKWLHRLVYAAFTLVVLHVWSVGTHLAYSEIQIVSFVLLLLLSGLELFKVIKVANGKYLHLSKVEIVTLFVASWACIAALIISIPVVVQNYHSRHTEHSQEQQ